MDSKSLDAQAWRAAKRAGLAARKSRYQLSSDNHGGFLLLDPYHNRIVAGERFDLTAEAIIKYCKSL